MYPAASPRRAPVTSRQRLVERLTRLEQELATLTKQRDSLRAQLAATES